MFKILLLVIICCFFYSTIILSNESAPPSTSLITDTQRAITEQWIDINYNLDLFFSEQPYSKTDNKSLILAYYGLYKKEGEPTSYDYDIRASFHLPQTSERLRLIIEKENEDLTQSGNLQAGYGTDNTARPNARDNIVKSSFIAGISYLLPKIDFVKMFVNTGMRLDLPLDPFIKLSIQKNIDTKYINIFASQKFILYRQDGFQESTQLSFLRKWTSSFQTELVNTLSWTDKYDLFSLRNNLIFYQSINEKNSISYSAGANASFSPTFYYTGYDTSINYRRLLYQDWLFGDLSIGADYLKSDNFDMKLFVLTKAQVFFR
ncbi:MAG: hypothetical protein HQK51_19335 [Oligoflexia bacterium]|nr:hypothetical protein [Oligoflexia bacterium]